MDDEQTVVFTQHRNRLRPVLKQYIKMFSIPVPGTGGRRSDKAIAMTATAVELIIRDCYLLADELGLDVTDIKDAATARYNKSKELAPGG